MTTDQFLVVAVLFTSLLVFASGRFRVDVVALSMLVALVLTGVLETQEASRGNHSVNGTDPPGTLTSGPI